MLIAFSFSGCAAGSDWQIRFAESQGQLRVEPVDGADFDYIVSVGNVGDVGYNPDELETRNTIAISSLKYLCQRPAIIGEEAIQTGIIPIRNKPAITYRIRVKCG